jgi:hypothetical protein
LAEGNNIKETHYNTRIPRQNISIYRSTKQILDGISKQSIYTLCSGPYFDGCPKKPPLSVWDKVIRKRYRLLINVITKQIFVDAAGSFMPHSRYD